MRMQGEVATITSMEDNDDFTTPLASSTPFLRSSVKAPSTHKPKNIMEDNDDFTTPLSSSTPFVRSSVKAPSTHKPKHMYKRLVKKSIVYKFIKNRKVNTYSRLFDSVSLVKQKLEPHQVQLFRKTAFGPFLDARKMCCSGLLIHYLLGNLVEVENVANPFHMYFEIQDRLVCFSVLDFTTILGFNCHDTVPTVEQESSYRGAFWLKFSPTHSRVTRSDIKLLYQSLVKGNETDEDIIRLSLIYVLSHSFLPADPKVALNSSYLNLIDDIDAFNSYPWGRVIWNDMVSCFTNGAKCLKLNEAHYNVYGCVVALQVWAFESFPALREVGLALLVDPDSFPRVLRWTSAKKNPNTLNCSIFSNPNFVFQPIIPSTIELNHDNFHRAGILMDTNPPVTPKPTSKLTPCSASEKKQSRKKSKTKVKDQDEVILMLEQKLHDKSTGQYTSPLRTTSVPQPPQHGSSAYQKVQPTHNGVYIDSPTTNDPNNAPEEGLDFSMTQILNVAFDMYDPKDTNISGFKDSNAEESQPHISNIYLNQDGENIQLPKDALDSHKPIVFKQPMISVPEEHPKRRVRSPARYTPGSYALQKCKKPRPSHLLCPFALDPFAELKPPSERLRFSQYIMEGVVRGHRSTSIPKKYLSEEDKSINLVFFYDVIIDSKSWIYRLHEPAQWLDAVHVQVICFYLRMKAATYPYTENFSTCCTYIPDYLNKLYDKYKVGVVHPEDSASDGYLVDEIAGAEELYMLPFWECDRVYIPLNLFESHWCLVVLDIHSHCLFMYDSNNRRATKKPKTVQYMRGLIHYLPKVVAALKAHNQNASFNDPPSYKLEVIKVVPQQDNGGDCGIFMLKFAELLQMGIDINKLCPSKIPEYRAKWAHDLYQYGLRNEKEA